MSMSILPKKLNINSDTFDRDNIHAYFTNAMRIDEHLTYANEGNISIGETKITFSPSTTLVFSEKPTIRHKANLQKTESKHKMESIENVVQNTQNNSINEPPEHIIRVADNISIEPTIPPQWVGKAAKSDIDDKLRAIGEYENLITTETANGVSKDQGNIRLIVNTEKASKYTESIFDKVFIPSPTGTQKVAKSISRVSPTEVLDKHTLQTIGYRESKEKKDKDKTPNRVCRKKIFNGIKNIRILMEPQPYQKHLTKSTSNKYIGRKNINGYGKNHLYNLHFKNLEENHLHGRPKTVPKRCQRIKHKVWRNQNNKLLDGSSERSKKDVEFKSDAKFRLRTHKYVGYYGRKNNSKESQFRNNMKEKTCRARNNIKVKKRTRSRYNAKYNKGLYKTSEKRSTNAEGRTKQNLSRYTSKFRFGVPIGYNYNIYHRKLRAQDAIRYFGYGNTIVPNNTYEQGRCRPGIAYNIHECHLDDDDITEM
ncbi:hypothetical protein AX774_g829 [Zancudomyces culisetae]|uniref:Uncharacterized protein n=1 Tax=Zancudomyces culisetae TaxID=1213189 RepID=A0A1R1PX70_ZANCU|nr:hypothetical protein AX774_g829 [Zancudomyces culisetae]|eukprot:OMH85595.1 hypothetical protein AX774_g829 [Zancudomyces culisetae]